MSSPVRTDDDADDLLKYAPPWARGAVKTVSEYSGLVDLPPVALRAVMPDTDPEPLHSPALRADRDIIQLRRRLSLEPDIVPAPPVARRRRPKALPVVGVSLAAGLAAVIAFAVTILPSPHREAEESANSPPQQEQPNAQLLIENRQAYANEPLPLQLALNGTSGQERVIVSGLMSGTRLSAGNLLRAADWLLPAHDIDKVMAYPPKDFVGAMEASVDLRSPRNRLLDRRRVRLEWLPDRVPEEATAVSQSDGSRSVVAAAPSQKADKFEAGEIATLLRRSQELLKSGDIAAARLVLQRATNGGSVEAMVALGATYDPLYLRELGALGLASDIDKARGMYQRARELGSAEAGHRLDRLAGTP